MKAKNLLLIPAFPLTIVLFSSTVTVTAQLCHEHIVTPSNIDYTSRFGSDFICGFREFEIEGNGGDPGEDCRPPNLYKVKTRSSGWSWYNWSDPPFEEEYATQTRNFEKVEIYERDDQNETCNSYIESCSGSGEFFSHWTPEIYDISWQSYRHDEQSGSVRIDFGYDYASGTANHHYNETSINFEDAPTFGEEPEVSESSTRVEKKWSVLGDYAVGDSHETTELSEKASMHQALAGSQEGEDNAAWLVSFSDLTNKVEFTGQTAEFSADFEGLECGAKYEFQWVYVVNPDQGADCGSEFEIERSEEERIWDGEHTVEDEFPVYEDYTTSLKSIVAEKIEEPDLFALERCCREGSVPGSGDVSGSSVSAFFSMGAHNNGDSAGMIYLNRSELDWAAFHPSGLKYTGSSDAVEVIHGEDRAIRQIHAPQALADVVTIDAYAYEIDFYHPGDTGSKNSEGLYEPTGDPFTTWTITKRKKNPIEGDELIDVFENGTQQEIDDLVAELETTLPFGIYDLEAFDNWQEFGGSAPTEMVVIEETVGHSSTTRILRNRWKDTWIQIEALGERVIARSYEENGGNERTRTTDVKSVSDGIDGNGAYVVDEDLAKRTIDTLKKFDWGERIVERRQITEDPNDPDPPALLTTWEYYDDPVNDGDNYSRLRLLTNPNGYWERYEYDDSGRVTKLVSPYLDSSSASTNDSDHRVTEITYTTEDRTGDGYDDEVVETVQKIEGNEVSRSYEIEKGKLEINNGDDFEVVLEIQCQTIGAAWDAGDNLTTTRMKFADGDFESRIRSIERPDGTMDLYSYSKNGSSGELTITLREGEPNGAKDDIVSGTETVTDVDRFGYRISQNRYDIASSLSIHEEITTETDDFGRATRVDYPLRGTHRLQDYSACGCGLESVTDEEGITTTYGYDALGRRTSETRVGITTKHGFDAAGNHVVTVRIGTDSSEIVQGSREYDLAGRRISSTDAMQNTVLYTEEVLANGMTERRVIYHEEGQGQDEISRIKRYYPDGSIKEVEGKAASPSRYKYFNHEYGPSGFHIYAIWEMKIGENQSEDEWIWTGYDLLGRAFQIYGNDDSLDSFEYNDKGQLEEHYRGNWYRVTGENALITRYEYNGLGEREISAVDVSQNGQIDYGGNDRIVKRKREVVQAHGTSVHRITETEWPQHNNDSERMVSVHDRSVDGFEEWISRPAPQSSQSDLITHIKTEFFGQNERRRTTTEPDGTDTLEEYENGYLKTVTSRAADETQLSRVDYTYDEHGRKWTETDARNGTTTYLYTNADRIQSVTTPQPASGQNAQETSYVYDDRGRVKTETLLPDGAKVEYRYHPTGKLKKTWGDRTYPVEYTYDPQGRMRTMTTWQEFDHQNGVGQSGGATTEWEYHPDSGLIAKKIYPEEGGVSEAVDYTHDVLGRLKTRLWARGVLTEYSYNTAGDLTDIEYSDGTVDVEYNYTRNGLLNYVVDGIGTRLLSYYSNNELEMEDTGSSLYYPGSATFYKFISRDELNRVDGIGIANDGAGLLFSQNYTYEETSGPFGGGTFSSRLKTASQGDHTASYNYVNNSNLVNHYISTPDGTDGLTVSFSYDKLNRITVAINSNYQFTDILARRGYSYNDVNQRVEESGFNELDDYDSAWTYREFEYDDRGQVIEDKRYWDDGMPMEVDGQQFEYTYDHIGNRDLTTTNTRNAEYTVNLLNQYDKREVPSAVDVLGMAAPSDTVTVNGLTVSRYNAYFYKQLDDQNSNFDNSVSDVWEEVIVEAQGQEIEEVSGRRFLAKDPEEFVYDKDGNLLSDGRWTYTWDAENRLVEVEEVRNGEEDPPYLKKAKFLYDYMGRRVQKKVYEWEYSLGFWYEVDDIRYVYHKWNLLAELDSAGEVQKSYLWGMDIVEQRGANPQGAVPGQSAGGVGGLLAISDHVGENTYYPAYDGNGNIVALLNPDPDSWAEMHPAIYEYNAFGETIRATGPAADINPFRFSTKYHDSETDLYYYGFRYYSPGTGRFLNRDPINEPGSQLIRDVKKEGDWAEELNLYAFVENDPVNRLDGFGLQSVGPSPPPGNDSGNGEEMQECGTVITRRHEARCSPLPHQYIRGADGVDYDHGGIGGGTPWRERPILIPKDADCDLFTQCIADFHMHITDQGYNPIWRNCFDFVRGAIRTCKAYVENQL